MLEKFFFKSPYRFKSQSHCWHNKFWRSENCKHQKVFYFEGACCELGLLLSLTRSWMGNCASRRRSHTNLLTNKGVIHHTASLMWRNKPKTSFRKVPSSMVGWFCSFTTYNIASSNWFSSSVILWFYVTNQFFKIAIKSLRRKNTRITKWKWFWSIHSTLPPENCILIIRDCISHP